MPLTVGSAVRAPRSFARAIVIFAALSVVPLVAESQCGRTNPAVQIWHQTGYATVARGDSLPVITCSVKAESLDSLRIEPSAGVSVAEIREIFVPDSLKRAGVGLRKGHHAFLVSLKVSSDAEAGKRAYSPVYIGMGREKPETLVVATHLPTLRGVTTSLTPNGRTTFAVTVHDPAKDVGMGASVMLSGGCMSLQRRFVFVKVDSVQAVDDQTERLFFTATPLEKDCYADIVVRDQAMNEGRPRLDAAFLKP